MAYEQEDPDFHATRAAVSANARRVIDRSHLGMRERKRHTPGSYYPAKPDQSPADATPSASLSGGADSLAPVASLGGFGDMFHDLGPSMRDPGNNKNGGSGKGSMHPMDPYYLRAFGADLPPDWLKPAQKIRLAPKDAQDSRWEAVPEVLRKHRHKKPFDQALADYENDPDDPQGNVGATHKTGPKHAHHAAHNHAAMTMAHHMNGPSPQNA